MRRYLLLYKVQVRSLYFISQSQRGRERAHFLQFVVLQVSSKTKKEGDLYVSYSIIWSEKKVISSRHTVSFSQQGG